MKFNDLVDLSVGSLWRIKLRAVLTITGTPPGFTLITCAIVALSASSSWFSRIHSSL